MNTAPFVFVGTSATVLYCVDDLILFAADEDSLDILYDKLGKHFRVQDLGKAIRFLELDLTWNDNDSVLLRQGKLENKFLQDTAMEQSKSVRSPISENMVADGAQSNPLNAEGHGMYRSIVGSLMYIAKRTRPFRSMVTSVLPLYLQGRTDSHIRAADRVLRYLNGIKTWQVVL